MYGMLAVFAEFEREMIRERVLAGLARRRSQIERQGHFMANGSIGGARNLGLRSSTRQKQKQCVGSYRTAPG